MEENNNMEVEWEGDPKIIRLLNIMDDLGLQENPFASPEALVELAENTNNSDFYELCTSIFSLLSEIVPPELPTTLRFSFQNENDLKQLLISLGFTKVEKINEYETKLAMLDFLLCELQVYRMLGHQSLKRESNPTSENNVMETDQHIVSGTPLRELTDEDKIQRMCLTLDVPFSKNYASTLQSLMEKVQNIINSTPELKSKNIWEQNLTAKHLQLLEEINSMLKQDYSSRKTVLLKRLDVTLQTFLWSEKALRNKDEVDATLAEQKKEIAKLGESSINIFDIFAASSELTNIVKTSAKSLENKDPLKKIVIGSVPDRGGRLEQKGGQSNMPAFSVRTGATHDKHNVAPAPQRQQQNNNHKRRVQGNWNDERSNKRANMGKKDAGEVDASSTKASRGGKQQGGGRWKKK